MTGAPAPRQTRQRTAVANGLRQAGAFVSAQQLHDRLRRQGTAVGLTTVYRTLQGLADAGEVDLLVNDEGETVYRMCSDGHHHHLVCRDCGRTVEIEGPAVEDWAEATAQAHGFREISHTLELFGRCADCG